VSEIRAVEVEGDVNVKHSTAQPLQQLQDSVRWRSGTELWVNTIWISVGEAGDKDIKLCRFT